MAFCTSCGAQIPDGTKFCPSCGAAQEAAQPVQQPVYQQPVYQQPVYQEPQVNDGQKDAQAGSCLTMGILALIFMSTGLLGIIFASIGKKKVRAYEAQYGPATGKAKAGKIMSNVALPISIVMLIFWVIYVVAIIIMVAGAASSGSSSSAIIDFFEKMGIDVK
jgi:uncharacterized membrane protein YvbJ